MAVAVRGTFVLMNDGSAGNSGSATLNPSGTWAVGDLVIAAFVWSNVSAQTPPAGWTQIGSTIAANGTSNAVFYRILQSGDLATNWSWTILTATRYTGIAQAYTGFNVTTPIHTSTTGTYVTGTFVAPALTASIANFHLVNIWCGRWTGAGQSRQSIALPGTHTAQADAATASTSTNVDIQAGALTTQPTSAGTYGPYTATASANGGATANGSAFSIAITAATTSVTTVKVRIGGVWVTKPIKARVAGAWATKPLKWRSGGTWNP